MKRFFSKTIILTTAFLCNMVGLLNVQASTIESLSIQDVLARSELVFEGKVASKQSSWDATGTTIYTVITFDVDDVIKGDYSSDTLTLQFYGGEVGETGMMAEGSVIPEADEQGIYFIASLTKNYINPIVGWSQGHFKIRQDESGVERIIAAENRVIVDVDAQPSNQGEMFSNGVARGLTTSTFQKNINQGMKKTEFKKALQQLLLKQE